MHKKFLAFAVLIVLPLDHSSYASSDTVKVYKSAMSIQCGSRGIKRDEMEKELTDKGIRVLASCHGSDGLSRLAVCGEATGALNVYQISSSDVQKARALGFGVLNELPHPQDDCARSKR